MNHTKEELIALQADLGILELTAAETKDKIKATRKRIRSLKITLKELGPKAEPGSYARSESKKAYDRRIRQEKKRLPQLKDDVTQLAKRLKEDFNYVDEFSTEFVPYQIPNPPPPELSGLKLSNWRYGQREKVRDVEFKWFRKEKARLEAIVEKEQVTKYMQEFF